MTNRLPILSSAGSEGGNSDPNANASSRLLIVCPLADIFSGVGLPSTSVRRVWDRGV